MSRRGAKPVAIVCVLCVSCIVLSKFVLCLCVVVISFHNCVFVVGASERRRRRPKRAAKAAPL